MRDFDPTASEFITSGYLQRSQPGGVLYDIGSVVGGLIGANASEDAAATQAASADRATAVQKEMFDKQVELQAPFRDAGLAANNRLAFLLGLTPPSSGGSGSKTYEQLRAELLPQYTTQSSGPSGGPSPFHIGLPDAGARLMAGAIGNWKMMEGKPTTSPAPQSVINEAALDAAIRARMAGSGSQTYGDPSDPAFGSLMRRFSMADFEADPGYAFRMKEGLAGVESGAAARGGLLSGAALKAVQKYGQGLASQEYGNAYNRFTADQTNQYNRLAGLVNTGQGATNQVGNAAANFGQQAGANAIGAGNAIASGQIGQANALVGGINAGMNNYQNNRLMDLIRSPGGTRLSGPSNSEIWSQINGY